MTVYIIKLEFHLEKLIWKCWLLIFFFKQVEMKIRSAFHYQETAELAIVGADL